MARIVHTGDWHLGKVLKGRPRLPEQRRVLAELVALADAERADLVIVAGDVFESAAPPPDAEQVAWETLLSLRATGAEVLVIAGNHDHAESFEALAPVFRAAGVHLLGRPARPSAGGVVELSTGGGDIRLAVLPFVSQRGVVRAGELMSLDAADLGGHYALRYQRLVDTLCAGFEADACNVVVSHAFVRGGRLGGGERDAHTIHDYSVAATAFPASANYVALGHLHRVQQIPGPCPIWYPGSPIAVDFGEEADTKGVLVIDGAAGRPAQVRRAELAGAVPLRTVRGDVAGIAAAVADLGEALIRAVVTEPARPGLAEAVQALHDGIVEVRVEHQGASGGRATGQDRAARTPRELFSAYLGEAGVSDPRLESLFGELLDLDASEQVSR